MILATIRLVGFFRQSTRLGPIAAMILHIVIDMIPLMIMLVLVVVAGGLSMPLFSYGFNDPLASESVIEYQDPVAATQTVFMWMFGEFNWWVWSATFDVTARASPRLCCLIPNARGRFQIIS